MIEARQYSHLVDGVVTLVLTHPETANLTSTHKYLLYCHSLLALSILHEEYLAEGSLPQALLVSVFRKGSFYLLTVKFCIHHMNVRK